MSVSLAVLGCGNMAQAILKGFAQARQKSSDVPSELKIYTYTPSQHRAQALAQDLNAFKAPGLKAQAVTDLSALPACNYYLIACKPQQVKQLAHSLGQHQVPKHGVVLSLLAGTKVESLSQLFKCQQVVRIMPNTPCHVGAGLCTIYFTQTVARTQQDWVQAFFRSVGEVMVFEQEELIDKTTSVSGSGPAYLFHLAHILEQYLQTQVGLTPDQARTMVQATLFGASKLLMGQVPLDLQNQVACKGGVTAEALQVLVDRHLSDMIYEALDTAYEKGQALAKLSEEKS